MYEWLYPHSLSGYPQYQQVNFPQGVQQFTPISGWLAVFADKDTSEPPCFYTLDVIALAIVANGQGVTRMAGMVASDGAFWPADDYATFVEYIREDDYNEDELEAMVSEWIKLHPEVFTKGEQE